MWNFENPAMTAWVQVALGLVLLFFGRKLFWVFVGVFGFLAGMQLASRVAQGQPELILLLIAIAFGIVGAVLAIVLQRVAVAIAGWFAGGYLAVRFAAVMGWDTESLRWIAFLVGAILAAIIVSLLFDWALIFLSALTGAIIVTDVLSWGQTIELILASVLFVLGVLAQARIFQTRPAASARREVAD